MSYASAPVTTAAAPVSTAAYGAYGGIPATYGAYGGVPATYGGFAGAYGAYGAPVTTAAAAPVYGSYPYGGLPASTVL